MNVSPWVICDWIESPRSAFTQGTVNITVLPMLKLLPPCITSFYQSALTKYGLDYLFLLLSSSLYLGTQGRLEMSYPQNKGVGSWRGGGGGGIVGV